MDFDQTGTDTLLGLGKEVIIDFGDLDLIFKVTPVTSLNAKFLPEKLVCTLSLEPNDGFWPNIMYYNIGIVQRFEKILVTMT